MEMFCFFTEMVLALNQRIVEKKDQDAQPVAGCVLVLAKE